MTALATPPLEASPPTDGARQVAVFASLMPDEVMLARRLRELQKRLLLGLVGLISLLIVFYGLSWFQTERSHSALTSENHRGTVEARTLHNYQPLVNAQSESNGITQTLSRLMSSDLQWPALIAHLRAVAPSGTVLGTITGSVTSTTTSVAGAAGSLGTSGLQILNQTGQLPIGSLTITGTAKDKNAVAAFADKLLSIPGMAAPLVTSVSGAKGTITFSINALITTPALGGRFAPPPTAGTTPTGGK